MRGKTYNDHNDHLMNGKNKRETYRTSGKEEEKRMKPRRRSR